MDKGRNTPCSLRSRISSYASIIVESSSYIIG
jgi:hypothetical protein